MTPPVKLIVIVFNIFVGTPTRREAMESGLIHYSAHWE